MEWLLPESSESHAAGARALADALNLPLFLAQLLCRRGFTCHETAGRFLDPRLQHLRDPFLIPQLGTAVERLLLAIDRRERIVLYGDYDVDGVTSLALFARILRRFSAQAAPEADPAETIQCFLPSRVDEGYGLSPEGLDRCLATLRPQLLVAVDCGTASAAEIARVTALGVEVIVFDHHLPKSEIPSCTALVNPKLSLAQSSGSALFAPDLDLDLTLSAPREPDPTAHLLCSVGLVFKAVHGLLKRRPLPGCDLKDYLDLIALGTVADLVPLEGENRTLVKRGLVQMERTRWPGLRALIEIAGLRAPFSPGDIGFKLGPRLNAAGRLGTAHDALELLLTEDPARARELAASLDGQNRDRQSVEEGVLKAAEAQIAAFYSAPGLPSALVCGAPGWHPGVVGIVASRLMQKHHRPVLVIAFDEATGLGKGSGRSIAGYSLVAALEACGHLLHKHGGHEMAAGLALHHEHFESFRQAFASHAEATLTAEQLLRKLRLDAELPLHLIDFALLTHHECLQPFGLGNPQPVFFARGVHLAAEPRLLKGKHLSLLLRQGRHQTRAIWFGATETPGATPALPPEPWDIAYRIERNEYQGQISVQLQIRAIRKSA